MGVVREWHLREALLLLGDDKQIVAVRSAVVSDDLIDTP